MRAGERIRTMEAELADRRAAVVEAETTSQSLRARSEELDASLRQAEMKVLELEAVVAEGVGAETKIAELTAALQMRDALVRERDERVAQAEERAAVADTRASQAEVRAVEAEEREADAQRRAASAEEARQQAEPSVSPDRLAELESALATAHEELDQSQTRLRRAYAETENIRAQLEAATPRTGLTGDEAAAEEIQRLRVELGQAMERAAAAENRASRLQADLAEARAGVAASEPDDEEGPDTDDDRSLRFRLARSAARKKGLGDEQMWS